MRHLKVQQKRRPCRRRRLRGPARPVAGLTGHDDILGAVIAMHQRAPAFEHPLRFGFNHAGQVGMNRRRRPVIGINPQLDKAALVGELPQFRRDGGITPYARMPVYRPQQRPNLPGRININPPVQQGVFPVHSAGRRCGHHEQKVVPVLVPRLRNNRRRQRLPQIPDGGALPVDAFPVGKPLLGNPQFGPRLLNHQRRPARPRPAGRVRLAGQAPLIRGAGNADPYHGVGNPAAQGHRRRPRRRVRRQQPPRGQIGGGVVFVKYERHCLSIHLTRLPNAPARAGTGAGFV